MIQSKKKKALSVFGHFSTKEFNSKKLARSMFSSCNTFLCFNIESLTCVELNKIVNVY